jgi:hypothetical protein
MYFHVPPFALSPTVTSETTIFDATPRIFTSFVPTVTPLNWNVIVVESAAPGLVVLSALTESAIWSFASAAVDANAVDAIESEASNLMRAPFVADAVRIPAVETSAL